MEVLFIMLIIDEQKESTKTKKSFWGLKLIFDILGLYTYCVIIVFSIFDFLNYKKNANPVVCIFKLN